MAITRKRTANEQRVETPRHLKNELINMGFSFLKLFLCMLVLSIIWEFIRLYQEAKAKQASKLWGVPAECLSDTMSYYASLKSWLRWQFSWTRDPCADYHYALYVNPLWEVTPLLVLSSVLSRFLLQPVEVIAHTLSRSLRSFLSELPSQWQLIIMSVILILILVAIFMTCRYRLSIPTLLNFEPSSPVPSPAHDEKGNNNGVVRRQGRNGCDRNGQEFSALKNIRHGGNDQFQSERNVLHSKPSPRTDHSPNSKRVSLACGRKQPIMLEAPKNNTKESLNNQSPVRSRGLMWLKRNMKRTFVLKTQ